MNLREAMRFDGERAALYLERGWWSPSDTLSRWLVRAASETPDAPAIAGDGQSLTYGELAARVAALAGGLKALGLGPGDVVAVQLPNRAEYLTSYLAICAIGAVMTTLYVPYRAAEMETLLGHSGARAFIGLEETGDFRACADRPRPAGPDPHAGACHRARRCLRRRLLLRRSDAGRASRTCRMVRSPPTRSCCSTPPAPPPGPRACRSPTRAFSATPGSALRRHGITNADRILSAAPFGHLYALYSFHLALATGATTVLLPAFTPPDLARILEAESVTVLFAAPAHVAACLGAGLLDAGALARVRLAVLLGQRGGAVGGEGAAGTDGGRPRHPALGHDRDPGRPSTPGPGIRSETVAGSAGRPSPGTEVRVVGPDDATLPAGEEGELHVRGSLLFAGYFNHPEANRDAFSADGWFRTGDLAVVDADGNVAITGRSKDVINRGGVKYNPRDIEDLLAAHPQVDMAAIVPVPDPVLGERACCCITVAGGEAPTLEGHLLLSGGERRGEAEMAGTAGDRRTRCR